MTECPALVKGGFDAKNRRPVRGWLGCLAYLACTSTALDR